MTDAEKLAAIEALIRGLRKSIGTDELSSILRGGEPYNPTKGTP